MRKNKFIIFLLAVTAAAMAFTACGKKGDETSDSVSESTSISASDSTGDSTGDSSGGGLENAQIYMESSVELAEMTSYQIEYVVGGGATAKDLQWSSSNPEVATVDQNGMVSAIAIGETIINATVKGTTIAAECKITVIKSTVFPVLWTKQTDVMPRVGGSVYLQAEVHFDGVDIEYTDFTWESADPTIATVDAEGNVTGVAVGTTTVKVSATHLGYKLEKVITVTVVANPA